jgi:hypothetical protein
MYYRWGLLRIPVALRESKEEATQLPLDGV